MDERFTTHGHRNNKKQKRLGNHNGSINDLPDFLLHHIISLLQIHDAFRTSFVSRRWSNLWISVPDLEFRESNSKIRADEIVPFINKVISLHKGSTIRRFNARFPYRKSHSSSIDSWIHFAVERSVDEFDLDLFGCIDPSQCWHFLEMPYKLPSCLFNCHSLRVLVLKRCDLNLHGSVCLNSLKTLILEMVEIDDVMIKTLISGSPLLEEIEIISCKVKSGLNIVDPNRQLKCLKILGFYRGSGDHDKIEIHAPNLLSFEFSGCMPFEGFNLKSLSSLVSASFDFGGGGLGCHLELLKILGDVRHAKVIKLGGWCTQVLEIWAKNCFGLPSCKALHLELRTSLSKWELPGITYLLRQFRHIESLKIVIDQTQDIGFYYDTYEFDEREYWNVENLSFVDLFQHLKTVNICGFMSNKNMSLEERRAKLSSGIFEHWEYEIELVKFLLKNSKALERMTLRTPDIEGFYKVLLKSEMLFDFCRKLLAFPRASPKAEISFS